MLKIEFNKDYPQTGNKAGDVIKIKATRLNQGLAKVASIVEDEPEVELPEDEIPPVIPPIEPPILEAVEDKPVKPTPPTPPADRNRRGR
jgi:hypothetical protein